MRAGHHPPVVFIVAIVLLPWHPALGETLSIGSIIVTDVIETAAVQGCHPSYRGACVPIGVEDVDCWGGSGNGPYYVRGPIEVVGPDVYGLDSKAANDPDNIGCE